MLKVADLKNFNKFKNPPNSSVQTVVTDATPTMKETQVVVNNLDKVKINYVPESIGKMVDKATQTVSETVSEETEPVSEDE